MRRRWEWLIASSIVTLVGMAWTAARLDMSIQIWGGVKLGGMVICAGLAIWAAIARFPRKWPAAVALVCAAPLLLDIVRLLPSVAFMLRWFGLAGVMMLLGAIAVGTVSIVILGAKPPPPAVDRIARARVVDR